MSTLRRRLMMAAEKSHIPSEYQLVEYLSNIGTSGMQYINTGVVDNQPIDFDAEVLFVGYFFSFGVTRQSYVESYFSSQTQSLSQFMFAGSCLNVPTLYSVKYRVRKVGGYAYVNDTEYLVGQGSNWTSFEWYIFNLNRNNAPLFDNPGRGHIYHISFSANNTLLRDMYPVYRKADNKPGLYDIVNNQFYVNQGTGEFTVGPDKVWQD